MATSLYTGAVAGLLGAINLLSDTIKACLVSTSYTFAASETAMTTAASARVGTDQTLADVSVTGGVVDATDPVWSAVAAGSTIGGVILYKFVTNDAGSTPILYIDLTDTPTNGSDITVAFDNGANKIFKFPIA